MSKKGRAKSRRTRARARAAGFRSEFERQLGEQLTEAGVDYEYETVEVDWILEKVYTPDFILPNGVIVEAKGRFDPDDRTKHLCIKEQYPDLDIRFVFQYDNPLTSGRKRKKNPKRKVKVKRYSDWCEANGFLYAFKTIPEEWLDE